MPAAKPAAAPRRPRSRRAHRDALTRILRSTGLVQVPEAALIIATLRDLAKVMDEGGGSRYLAAYLTAQKDLQRMINAGSALARPQGSSESSARKKPASADAEDEAPEAPVRNELADFKKKRGIA